MWRVRHKIFTCMHYAVSFMLWTGYYGKNYII